MIRRVLSVVAVVGTGLLGATAADAAPGDLHPLSIGNPVAWSADGHTLLFNSTPNEVDPSNPVTSGAAFVDDVRTGTITQLAPSQDGTTGVALSADGTHAALSGGDGQAYVEDTTTGALTLASTTASGALPTNATLGSADQSLPFAISADGSKVLFRSNGDNLTPVGTTCFQVPVRNRPKTVCADQLYLKDLTTGAVTLVSARADGTLLPGDWTSTYGSISADGTKVALSVGLPFNEGAGVNLYVKDLQTGALTLVRAHGGSPQISADGTKIAFDDSGPSSTTQVYVDDLATGTVTAVSTSQTGVLGDGRSFGGRLSADDRYIAIETDTSFDPADTNGLPDIYVKDLSTGDITLASTTSSGVIGDSVSVAPLISPDGTRVAFATEATNLDASPDTLFLKELSWPDQVSQTASAGQLVATSGDPRADDPVKTSITTPNAGAVSISETNDVSTSPPNGFTLFARQVDITAPPASAGQPLQLTFQLDPSVLPSGVNPSDVRALRDGVPIGACTGTPGTASPDPCMSDNTVLPSGAIQITVLSSHASTWNLGYRSAPSDATPPQITAQVNGAQGQNGWYTGDVSVNWTVTDPESQNSVVSNGCGPSQITSDTTSAGVTLTCSATSDGGDATKSVTINRDATAPTLGFSGDSTYTVDQTVNVTCTATDPAPGSGLASNPCTTALTHAPAYTLPLGVHSVNATATDAAGNSTTKTTAFTVAVTPASLCRLTTQFVQSGAAYARLGTRQKQAIDALAAAACANLDQITSKLRPAQKTVLVGLYKAAVTALVSPGWLTSAQATTLKKLADAL